MDYLLAMASRVASMIVAVTVATASACLALEGGAKNQCASNDDCNAGRTCHAGVCGEGDITPTRAVIETNSPSPSADASSGDATSPVAPPACSGEPLTATEITAVVGAAQSIVLGGVTFVSRSRTCNGNECGAFEDDNQFSFVRLAGKPDLPYQWESPLTGVARLGHSEIDKSKLSLQIMSHDAAPTDGAGNTDLLRIECFDQLGTASTSCRSWAEFRHGGVIVPDGAPTLLVGEERSGFSGVITRHCLRFTATGSFARGASRRETQVIVYGQY